jgi:hypothetical protein
VSEHPADRWARETREEKRKRISRALRALPDPPEQRASTEEWTEAIADVVAATLDATLEELVEWFAERAGGDLEQQLAILGVDRAEVRRRVAARLREPLIGEWEPPADDG